MELQVQAAARTAPDAGDLGADAAPWRGLEGFREELLGVRLLAGRRQSGGWRGAVAEELQRFAIALAAQAFALRRTVAAIDRRRVSARSAKIVDETMRWCSATPIGQRAPAVAAEAVDPWQLAFFESEAADVARRVVDARLREVFRLERTTLEPLARETEALAALVQDHTGRLRRAVRSEAGAYSGAEALAVIDWIADPWEGVAWDGDDYLGWDCDGAERSPLPGAAGAGRAAA